MDTVQKSIQGLDIASPTASSALGYSPPGVSRCSSIVQNAEGKYDNYPNDGTQSCGGCHLVRVSLQILIFRASLIS